MSYCLGVDLGTTYSAAAVWRHGQVVPAPLGHATNVVPSVLFLTADGELLVGETAERRALSEPTAVSREFKRRMGDPVPVLLRTSAFPAEELTARLLRSIVDRVVEQEGGWPDALAVTHPANWGEHRIRTLHRAVELASLRDVRLLSEPEAAAVDYATRERVPPGHRVVVYDLGGGTFDVAVLERSQGAGHRFLGRPQGIDDLGGSDFDQLLFRHVCGVVGLDAADLDTSEARVARQLAALRAACVAAKIDLSTNPSTAVLVTVGPVDEEVRVTRAEFERLIQQPVSDTVDATLRAVASAELEPGQVQAVLLVGGSSRIPYVARAVSAALRTPVAVDTHSKHAVAMGAATWVAQQAGLAVPDDRRPAGGAPTRSAGRGWANGGAAPDTTAGGAHVAPAPASVAGSVDLDVQRELDRSGVPAHDPVGAAHRAPAPAPRAPAPGEQRWSEPVKHSPVAPRARWSRTEPNRPSSVRSRPAPLEPFAPPQPQPAPRARANAPVVLTAAAVIVVVAVMILVFLAFN